jgi:Zn-dependent peptidase ImmA (M78 family)
MNVEKGLAEVVRALNKMGITVTYLPRFKSMHVRGATFAVNQKPCIVLTDYRGNYPTLWFTLLHELHHVLFDWDEILVNSFHLSGDTNLYTESEVETEANQFARDYLFSDEKMKQLIPHINDRYFVEEFAKGNHVHWSIPYIFYAFDMNSDEIWRRTKAIVPKADACLKHWPNAPFTQGVKINAKYNTDKILN